MAKSEIIEKEIIPKGKCYVICKDLEGESFLEEANRRCKDAYTATEIELIGLSNDNRYEYMNYHNDAFFDVPNSMTIDDDEINLILEDSAVEAGLLCINNEAIGTYHLDFSEENPEIASISINNNIQGKGYGVLALKTLEEYLYYKGYKEVFLRVATLNENAYALYKKSEYKYLKRFSRWFLVRKKLT